MGPESGIVQVEARNVGVELYWNNYKEYSNLGLDLLVIKVACLRILF